MEKKKHSGPRRTLLMQAVGLVGAGTMLPGALLGGPTPIAKIPATEPEPAATPPYQSLSPDEATFVETLVNIMCPADEYSPNGVDCGLATYMDRQLAGPFGKGDGRYQRGPFRNGKAQLGLQLPLTPEQFFKGGIAACNAACVRDRGQSFDQLTSDAAGKFLTEIQTGKVLDERLPLASWLNDLVYPLFVEGCFSDPMYGGNRNAVFWKMIGYPGLPATHTLDIVRFRGKPYPGAKNPKSIADFT
jgi:gluconate 2-dehydrogenase gamma chain